MDYEKKYKEALAKARHYYLTGEGEPVDFIKMIFPEFAESEDERIRKGLVRAVSETLEGNKLFDTDVTREEALAWLEKQNTEMKDVISMDVNSETEWDDIHKFLRMNLDGEKVKLLIIREE